MLADALHVKIYVNREKITANSNNRESAEKIKERHVSAAAKKI